MHNWILSRRACATWKGLFSIELPGSGNILWCSHAIVQACHGCVACAAVAYTVCSHGPCSMVLNILFYFILYFLLLQYTPYRDHNIPLHHKIHHHNFCSRRHRHCHHNHPFYSLPHCLRKVFKFVTIFCNMSATQHHGHAVVGMKCAPSIL